MSRMFKSVDRTWNVFVGCEFDCIYCNARETAETRLKNCPRYKYGFWPHIISEELQRKFKPGEFIFVAYMGDISFAAAYDLWLILKHIRTFPQTDFLLMTKNPRYFWRWPAPFPPNVILGTTIESNRDYGLSKAPTPYYRFLDFQALVHPRKMLSIEPVMDFDTETFRSWIKLIKPEIIEIGADNYHNNLPEPPAEKLKLLIQILNAICPRVIEKDGLDRLKERR